MNTRKLIYGLFALLVLMAAACTPSDTAEEDKLYEVGVDKRYIKVPGSEKNVDKKYIKVPGSKNSVDKKYVIIK